jgi:hypothetical protein
MRSTSKTPIANAKMANFFHGQVVLASRGRGAGLVKSRQDANGHLPARVIGHVVTSVLRRHPHIKLDLNFVFRTDACFAGRLDPEVSLLHGWLRQCIGRPSASLAP